MFYGFAPRHSFGPCGAQNKTSSKRHVTTTVCHKCGNKHDPRQCPAYAAVCHKCGKNNHFSEVFRVGTEKSSNYKTKTINNLESEVDSLYIGMIGKYKKEAAHQAKGTVWHETATVRGVAIDFKLDTGADFHVSSRADKPILGGDACEELQLVKRVEALTARSPHPGKAPATK